MRTETFNSLRMDVEGILENVAKLVSSIVGPNNGTAVIDDKKDVYITNNSAFVLDAITDENPYINNILNIIKENTKKALKETGDGTASVVILANEMLDAIRNRTIPPSKLENKIKQMIDFLPKISKSLNTQNAKTLIETVAGRDRELAKAIYDAYMKAKDENLLITVETDPQSHSVKNRIVNNSIYFEATAETGFIKEADQIIIENPYILCYDGIIKTKEEALAITNKISSDLVNDNKEEKCHNVIIIAEGCNKEAVFAIESEFLRGISRTGKLLILTVKEKDVCGINIIDAISKVLNAKTHNNNSLIFKTAINTVDIFKYNKGKVFLEGIKHCDENAFVKEREQFFKKMVSKVDKEKLMFLSSLIKRKRAEIVIGGKSDGEIRYLKKRAENILQSLLTAEKYGVVSGAGRTYSKLNKMTDNNNMYENIFSSVEKAVNAFDSEALDSAKTIETVLLTAFDLALMLNDIKFVICNNNGEHK